MSLAKFMAICTFVLVPNLSFAQGRCNTTVECAQVAVEAAARAEAAVKSLQERQDAQEEKNAKSRTMIDVVVAKSNADGTDGPIAANLIWGSNQASCPAGHYMSGIKLAWRGTCKKQCDGDGGILGGITLVCKSIQ